MKYTSFLYLTRQTFFFRLKLVFVCLCIEKYCDDSVKSFERNEYQLFHFPSQLKRKKKNALETEQNFLYPLSPCNQFDVVPFLEESYWEAEVAEKEKDLIPNSLEKDVQKDFWTFQWVSGRRCYT